MRAAKYSFIVFLITVFLLITACSDTDQANNVQSAKDSLAPGTALQSHETDPRAVALLDAIPADTAYVMTMLEPMPKAVVSAYLDYSRFALQRFQALAEEESAGETKDQQQEQLIALLEEITELMDYDRLHETGISPDAVAAFYGVGGIPVTRTHLIDRASLRRLIDRIFTVAETPLEWKTLGNIEYLRIKPTDTATQEPVPFDILIGLDDEWLITSFVDHDANEEQLSRIFGIEKPQMSLAVADIEAINRDNRYLPYGSGYLDLMAVAESLYNKVPETERTQDAEQCLQVLKGFLSHADRIVGGYTELDTSVMALHATWQMSQAVTGALSKIQHPMPGYDSALRPIYALGISANLPALRDALTNLLNLVGESAENCSLIDQQKIAEAQVKMAFAMNPLFSGYKSLVVSLNDLQLGPPNGEQPPAVENIKGMAIASMDDPRGTVAMLSLLAPQLASLKFPDDGTPVEIPLESDMQGQVDGTLMAAISENKLGVAVGVPPETLTNWLTQPVDQQSPFLWIAYDYPRMMALITEQSAQDDETREILQFLEELYAAFGFTSQTVTATDRGIEIMTRMELQLQIPDHE